MPLSVIDLSGFNHAEQESEEQALIRQETRHRFDLALHLPIRFLLLRRSSHAHTLVVTVHHIAADCWSLGLPFQSIARPGDPWHTGILFRELLTVYGDMIAGRFSSLPVLPIQFTDYAHWQNERLAQGDFRAHAEFWKKELSGAPEKIQLPPDFADSAPQDMAGVRYEFSLESDLCAELESFRQANKSAALPPLLASFGLALRAWSGEKDIVIGTPISNRTDPATFHLIGPAANALCLRLRIEDDVRVGDFVNDVRETILRCAAHQDFPFAQLVQDRGASAHHPPVFQVRFALQQAAELPVQAPGLRLAPIKIDRGVSRYDLSLVLAPHGDGFRAWCEYNTSLFKPATIENFAKFYQRVARALLAGANRRVADIVASESFHDLPPRLSIH